MPLLRSLLLASTFAVAPLSVVSASNPVLKIDPARTGAPIHPFIYGQFIEHLGRCIYGGIWAEMLEDRKFYFPVTPDYAPYKSLTDTAYPVVGASPWQIIGAPDGVRMVKENAFVGEHSPLLRAGAGLRQRDLGVVAGRGYTGYLWLRAPGAKPAAVDVTLVWGEGAGDRATVRVTAAPGDFAKQPFAFTAGASTDHAQLEVRATDADVLLGTLSLMPADNVHGLRRDTLALLKQLHGSIYRWPGGNFVSGYDWRDGIGDRDRRPPRKNPAWTGVEHNDFGTDEFIAFCREIDAEPMIAANTGFGDAHSAAQWVEYCNRDASTLAGGWRAQNGHPAPYGVRYWCVGNEMFGPWQLGFMQLSHYTIKHNLVAEAMWKVDPSLQLAAVGDLETINAKNDPEQAKSGHTWSHGMLLACADHMNVISEHFYEGRLPWTKNGRGELAAEVVKLKHTIRRKADGHRALQASLPNLSGRFIPISMDEWNYWHRDYVYGELGCVYDQADALGVAMGLHEYFRQSDVIHLAFYAQTVNVIGAIKTSRTAAEMETTGLVLSLYRAHFGSVPLKLEGDFGALDVAAALTADGRTLTVAVVNPTAAAVALPLALAGHRPAAAATRWTIAAPDEFAHNAPGRPRAVDIVAQPGIDATQPLAVPAFGVALFSIPLK
ncbi:alpha-L-arabinofuranosidase C-terminal domain-containing protein [Oleiharenicola sp. Vm1]|uniref:alpha-L-arabinofuranosidase C-terminal domain-containing protein n=1 Tax=Oleiharenicola sp. Vm1 TaxID=3398393 RepID=UPI0039F5F8C0